MEVVAAKSRGNVIMTVSGKCPGKLGSARPVFAGKVLVVSRGGCHGQ